MLAIWGGVVSPGNVRRAGDDIPEFEDDVLRSAEESFGVGGRSPLDDIPDADIGDVGRSADDLGPREIPMRDPGIPLDPSGNVIPMASSAERAAAASAGGARAARGGIETLAESPTKTPLLTKNRALAAAGGVAGLAGLGVLVSNLSEDEEEVVTDPAVTSASVDTGGTGGDGDPPPPPPDPSIFSRIGDYFGDPRIQAGLMKVAKPTAGFTKRNPLVDFYEGKREYDVEEADIRKGEEAGKTAMMKNLELIKKLQPEMKDEEVLNLLLGEKKKTKEDYLTLFVEEEIKIKRILDRLQVPLKE